MKFYIDSDMFRRRFLCFLLFHSVFLSACGIEQSGTSLSTPNFSPLTDHRVVLEVLPSLIEISGPVGWHYAGFEFSEHAWEAEALVTPPMLTKTLRWVLRRHGLQVLPLKLADHIHLGPMHPTGYVEGFLTDLHVKTYDWWTGRARTEAVATVTLRLSSFAEEEPVWSGEAQGRATGGEEDIGKVIRRAMAQAMHSMMQTAEFQEVLPQLSTPLELSSESGAPR